MNLRSLSLDRTPPQDYDPPGTLRWDADLTEIADYFGSDKGSLKHSYTPHYERLLGHLRQEPVNLLEIGVNLTTENVGTDFATFLGREVRREYNVATTLFLSGPYPDAQLYIYHRTGPGGSRNYGDYGSAELDAMLDEQRGIYDQEERREKVYEIQRYIINNPGPAWIGSRIGFGVQTAKMRNVRAHPFLAGYDDAENVWLKA